MLTVHCPGCGATLQAPLEAAGRTIRCALCSARFVAQLSENAPRTSHTILGNAVPTQTSQREELHPGDTLGEYEILSKLGQGGMGTVWKAKHKRLGRLVAIKVLSPHLLGDSAALARFQREVEALGRLGLDHPNLVRAYDAGMIDGLHFLVMELLQGEDLARVLQTRRRLPAGEACGIVLQTLSGLQYAHDHGLVHRDIKPSNLMLAQASLVPVGDTISPAETSTVVKILDLGLAHLKATALNADAASITGTHQMLGTPDYMAPEQIESASQVDIRADLYSVGCTLYHLLTGRPPFVCAVAAQKMAGHMFNEPTALSQLCPDLPNGLAAVVGKMMAKKREARYQTPVEAARALRPFSTMQRSGSISFQTKTEGHHLPPVSSSDTPHVSSRTQTLAGDDLQPPPPEGRSTRVVLLAGLIFFIVIATASVSVALFLLSKKKTDDTVDNNTPDTPVVEKKDEKKAEEKKVEEKKPQPVDLSADLAALRQLISAGSATDEFIRKRGPERFAAWQQAATENQLAGRYLVARCQELGVGTKQDERQALDGYRAAADSGLLWAQFDLARVLEMGIGTEKNVDEALAWYEKADAQGHRLARERVAELAYQQGEVHYRGEKKDGVQAEPFYRKAAERGHSEAQFQLAYIYANGHSGQKKPEEAVLWYGKAAAQGHLIAKNNLGVAYARGDGVTQDAREAARLYKEAADAGYNLSMSNLSFCYEQGTGVPVDLELAVLWCQKAVDANYAPARDRLPPLWAALGQAYFDGKGKEKNFARAEEWSRKAADQNHRDAQFRLGWILDQGLAGPAKPAEAAQWYQKAADQGHLIAMNNLGDLHERGRGVEQNKFKAFRFYETAAEGGHALAMFHVGRCYEHGIGVDKNPDEMVVWYEKAANAGNPMAQARLPEAWYLLGEALATGKGKEKDAPAALRWLEKSAERGHQHAQFRLGWLLTNGEAGPADPEKGLEWYRKSAAQGNSAAMNNIGFAYARGLGVKEDLKEAFKHYLQAAEKGDLFAMTNVGNCYEYGRGVDMNRDQALVWYRKAADKGNEKAKAGVERLTKKM